MLIYSFTLVDLIYSHILYNVLREPSLGKAALEKVEDLIVALVASNLGIVI